MAIAYSLHQKKKIGSYIGKYLLAAFLISFALLPFLWVLATSFNAAKSLVSAQLIPSKLTLSNYTELLDSDIFFFSRWMFNSLKISAISVSAILFLTCISAYALSRFRFRSKKFIMMAIMIVNIFPGILAMIALFTMFQQIGEYIPFVGLNTHGALIAIYIAGSMSINVLMVKSYIDTIPRDLDESCLVEGATPWQTFWKVVFPMIKPITIAIGILVFMVTYGDFIIANIILKGNKNITVMLGIFQFTQQRFETDWGIVSAATIIAALPAVLMFFFTQKYIISGLTSGSVKG